MVSKALHPMLTVGVYLVDDCDASAANLAMEGLRNYDDYFLAQVLPVRFNSSTIRQKDGLYLTTDFFHSPETERMKDRFDVDLVLFITDHPINNWDGDKKAIWGEANTQSSSVIITTYYFATGTDSDKQMVRGIALHESFHLLGFSHNFYDRNGLMQYSTNYNSLKLPLYYELQLPVKAIAYGLLKGLPNFWVVMLSSALFALVLLPLFIALEILVYHYFKKKYGEPMRKSRWIVILNVVFAFALITVLHQSFYLLILPALLIINSHYTYYRRYKIRK